MEWLIKPLLYINENNKIVFERREALCKIKKDLENILLKKERK